MDYILEPYDDLLEEILRKGKRKPSRTGIDCLTLFGRQSRYDISERFPVVNRRKTWPHAVFAELLWMISGSTNVYDLEKLGCKYWTPWRDEEFEKKNSYIPGSLGETYGFQFRHFGGYYAYGDTSSPYGHGGFDQLAEMVRLLREEPDSRRNLFSLWNAQRLKQMKLPPCAYSFQCYVDGDELSGMLTQRSADYPAGVPANIAFYSALIYMLAQQTGLRPKELVHTTADTHLYYNQIEAVENYLGRPKPHSPKLNLRKAADIFSYSPENFALEDYISLPPIKMPVAV